jgi:hypothetical protein
VSQGKRNHNLCGVRLDCGSDALQEYRLKYDRALKNWNSFHERAGVNVSKRSMRLTPSVVLAVEGR